MIHIDEKELARCMCQSQAALLAVLISDIRQGINEPDKVPTPDEITLEDALSELEESAIESIRVNDGEIIRWVGIAAKQANPLLANT